MKVKRFDELNESVAEDNANVAGSSNPYYKTNEGYMRNLLPKLVSVSRNCRLTMDLNAIFEEKLDDSDMHTLMRWLQIVEEEKR